MNRHQTRPVDTTVEIDNMMIERYHQMTLAQRVDVMNDLTDMTTKLTIAGITAAHGELSSEAMRWHLCARRTAKTGPPKHSALAQPRDVNHLRIATAMAELLDELSIA